MKTIIRFATLISFLLMLVINVNAQNSFTGRIIYQISYEGLGFNESMKSMLPGDMTLTLGNNKSKSSISTAMGDQSTIFDSESKTMINLLDIMGKKIALRKSMEQLEIERKKYPGLNTTLSNDTKEILGYTCKKAIVTVNAADLSGPDTFTVYYTTELGNLQNNYNDALFHEIEGVMLEYEINTRGLLMKFLASNIVKEDIPESEFSIPPDYQETTEDELKKMFGSGLN